MGWAAMCKSFSTFFVVFGFLFILLYFKTVHELCRGYGASGFHVSLVVFCGEFLLVSQVAAFVGALPLPGHVGQNPLRSPLCGFWRGGHRANGYFKGWAIVLPGSRFQLVCAVALAK